MKNLKKLVMLFALAMLVVGMLATGVYALVAIGLSICAVECSVINVCLFLLSGVASGIICYILHKITF